MCANGPRKSLLIRAVLTALFCLGQLSLAYAAEQGKVTAGYNLERLRARRREAVNAVEERKKQVQSRIRHFERSCDPRLYDPRAQVPKGKKYPIPASAKSHRTWAEYVGWLMCSSEQKHLQRASAILKVISTQQDWRGTLGSHYSLMPILMAFPASKGQLDKDARQAYEAALKERFKKRPCGYQVGLGDDASFGVGSRVYRDAFSCLLAGQMLGMPETFEYGRKCISRIRWAAANRFVGPYNNQMYGPFFFDSVSAIIRFVDDWPSVLDALMLEGRLFLQQALMYHQPTGWNTGPETGRPSSAIMPILGVAYEPVRERRGVGTRYPYLFINPVLPDYLKPIMDQNPSPFTARFTARTGGDVVIHRSAGFSLATQESPSVLQAPTRYTNAPMGLPRILYKKPGGGCGEIDIVATEQLKGGPVSNYGQWFFLQRAGTLIGFYDYPYRRWTLRGRKYLPHEPVSALGVSVFFPKSMQVFVVSPTAGKPRWETPAMKPVWSGSPVDLNPGDMVAAQEGEVFVALHILESGDLGRQVQARVIPASAFRGTGWWRSPSGKATEVMMYTYEGALRTFDTRTLKRDNRCAFVLQLGDTSTHADFEKFVRAAASLRVSDTGHRGDKRRTVALSGWSHTMKLTYDPASRRIVEKTIDGSAPAPTNLECPLGRWSGKGRVTVKDASVSTTPSAPVYLFNTDRTYAVWKFVARPATVSLNTKGGRIEVSGMGVGQIVYRPEGDPALEVFTGRKGSLKFEGRAKAGASVEWNAVPIRTVPKQDGPVSFTIQSPRPKG